MLKKQFLALAVAASFASPAFSGNLTLGASEGCVVAVTQAQCDQYGGQVVNNECVLSEEQLATARDELCLALPETTAANGSLSGAGIAAVAGLLLIAAVAGGSDDTTTTTTTTTTD